MSAIRDHGPSCNAVTVQAIMLVSCAVLAACGGGSGSGPAAQATIPATTSSATGSGGKGGLDIGTQNAVDGALFFNDQPLAGETAISGVVTVIQGGTQGAAPLSDTVVTLNGVPLVNSSPARYTVNPASQPTIGADGFLHITASSVLMGVTRQLNLFCPPAFAVTPTPAPGSILAVGSSVKLDWASGSLPIQGRDFTAFGLTPPSVSLKGFNAATSSVTFLANPQPLAADAVGATVTTVTTTASGYLVELRYPGVYFVDGETGGACARTQRFVYVK
jgi:hypothetical protein